MNVNGFFSSEQNIATGRYILDMFDNIKNTLKEDYNVYDGETIGLLIDENVIEPWRVIASEYDYFVAAPISYHLNKDKRGNEEAVEDGLQLRRSRVFINDPAIFTLEEQEIELLESERR